MFKLFRINGHRARILVLVLFFATFLTNSLASTFYTSFTIAGFPVSNGNAAPTDPVSGTIVWTAPDINSDIESFISISLTLDGHNYSVPELGFFTYGPNQSDFEIGGTINGAAVQTLTDDFYLAWDSASLQPLTFAYASSKRTGIWIVEGAGNFESFTVAAVPEPGSVPLLLLGCLLGVLARPGRTRSWLYCK